MIAAVLRGPRALALTTALSADEIIVEIRLPAWPAGRRWGFQEFARRRGDFALAAAAVFYDINAVGKATRRQDGADKVKGRTRFAGDLPLAGLLHARLVHSPYAHARIVNIDTSAALAVPGVKAVYTGETLWMAKRDSS